LRAHGIAARLGLRGAQGREEAQAAVRRITGELAGLAERAAADADRLLANARSALRRAKARPRSWPRPACGTRPRAGAGAGCTARSMTWLTCWR
jgi:IS5 family transposase